MTKKGDPNPVVMLNSFQHLVKIFSAFGRHTFHPRPQDGVFRCDLNKFMTHYTRFALIIFFSPLQWRQTRLPEKA